MSEASPRQETTPLLSRLRRVDHACDAFEAAWRAGQRPRIEQFLGDTPEPERSDQLRHLLALELELRGENGETPTPEEYRSRFSEHLELIRSVFRNAPGELNSPYPTIAGYDISGTLGEGGMGVVYQAWQVSLKRLVALKMIRDQAYAGPGELARFRAEAEAVAQLQHPNIVQIYEVGEQDGRPYFSLELVDGGSLEKKLAGTPQPARPAAELTETLARAMHYAHQRGIVHRDLKPANILLSDLSTNLTNRHEEKKEPEKSRGAALSPSLIRVPSWDSWIHATPKITDFGLAKRVEGGAGQTESGAVLGTPSYMAPEQARGQSKVIGPATDVYALGAILYELLTGRPPFKAETPLETLLQVRSEEPVPPRRLQPKVPRDLETICLKCLQKEPHKRYASAAALADDLRRYLAGEPILARPTPSWERGVKWARRRPAVAALVGVSGAAAAGLVVFIGYWLHDAEVRAGMVQTIEVGEKLIANLKEDIEWKRAEVNQLEKNKQQALADAQAARADKRRIFHVADMRLAQAFLQENDIARVLDLLKRQQPEAGQEDLRGFEWYHFWYLCHGERRTLKGHKDAVTCVTFAPDGKTLASGSGSRDRTVTLWDPVTGQARVVLKGLTRPVSSLAFSPDSKTLATASLDKTVKVWDTAKGKQLTSLGDDGALILCVAFAPDGEMLATASLDKTVVKLWDPATGQERGVLKGHSAPVVSVAFAPAVPDGRKLLATASQDKTVRLWDPAKEKVLHILKGHSGSVTCVAFAPDGKTLATASQDKTVRLWDVATGQERTTLQGHTATVRSVAFRDDGETLASGSEDATLKLWDAVTGKERFTLKGHLGGVTSVAFSVDGETLASGSEDQTVKLWDPVKDPGRSLLPGHEKVVSSVAFSADSKRLATGSGDETARLWDLTKEKVPHILKGHSGSVTCVAFAPDGKVLATASTDKTVKLWDTATGEELQTLRGHDNSVTCVAFALDGARLASASTDRTVKLWDPATGKECDTFRMKGRHTGWARSMAFAPDGKTLATGHSDNLVRLWDVATGQERHLPGHTKQVHAVAFAPDGKMLATGSDDMTVKLWDRASGKEWATLQGHRSAVWSVAFASDGKTLAAASGDVKVWDVTTKEERATLKGPVYCVAFAPNSKRLAGGSPNGTVILWEAATDQEVEAASVKEER